MINDEFYMNLALQKAWEFQILTYPNPAVGCVILDKNGALLACEAHERAGEAHAELNAVKSALFKLNPDFKFPNGSNELYEFILANHNGILKGSKAYVTLEPCSHHGKTPPCANLLKVLGFSEVIIARRDENKKASGGAEILRGSSIKLKFDVLKDRADELIEPFLSWQSGNFSFFKIALCANGVATGGVISNEQSRTHMHRLRSVSDLLVIGGNTVRTDRPTLDTRLIKNGKNPDILIYSKAQNFDKTIPLFNVSGRIVEISNSLEKAFKVPLVMFEGGESFLNSLDERVSWVLIYQSSEFKNLQNLRANLRLKRLFSSNFGSDNYGWYKIIR